MKWDFIYDEEIFDERTNFIGIISNGKDVLFYHAYTVDVEKDEEVCEIYDSFLALCHGEPHNIKYIWTSENDEKLIDFLNSLPEDAIIHGDDSALLEIKFDKS